MIYIINNNTTHNYSKYSTRPRHIYNVSLKVKYPIQNRINSNIFDNNQTYLFQTKQLLCWGPDLAFLNLRNSFSNVFKALQICWSAARNNKKILFINGNDSIEADSTLVNTWLIQQCKRHNMPYKLNNISNIAAKYTNHLTRWNSCPQGGLCKQKSTSTLHNKALFNHLNTFLNSLKIKTSYAYKKKIQSFIQNSNTLFNSNLTRPLPEQRYKSKDFYFYARNHVEKHTNQRLVFTGSGSIQPKIKEYALTKTPKLEIQKASKIQNHNATMGKTVSSNEKQSVVNNRLQIKMKKAIQLQVKEAQTLTQQIGGEITAPLVGFLTNTKTGFNTLQNQLNEEFFNYCKSVYFNNTSKNLFKSIFDINAITKTKTQLQDKYEEINNNHRVLQDVIRKSHLKGGVYSQNYLPFSFYIRPINQFNALTSDCKAKQAIVRQNIFGKILAWRLKGQYPSSIFYSQFKIFDQRNKYKSKQPTMPNQSNIQAFKVTGFTKLALTKPQVLFKNTKNFITFKSPVIYKASLRFYSNSKSYKVTSKENRSVIASAIRGIYFKLKTNKHNSSVLVKKGYRNSIDHFYINRFYQSVKDGRTYSNQNKDSITNRSSITGLLRNHFSFKAHKRQGISNKVIPRLFRYHEKKFHNYYDKFIGLNQFNQYEMFAKSPFINNKLADIMFFINPEKNQNLVNQANCLKIPTIGVISGMATSRLGRPSCNHYSLNNLVNYPIVGNPSSSFFIYSLLGVFIKTLRSS